MNKLELIDLILSKIDSIYIPIKHKTLFLRFDTINKKFVWKKHKTFNSQFVLPVKSDKSKTEQVESLKDYLLKVKDRIVNKDYYSLSEEEGIDPLLIEEVIYLTLSQKKKLNKNQLSYLFLNKYSLSKITKKLFKEGLFEEDNPGLNQIQKLLNHFIWLREKDKKIWDSYKEKRG